MKAELKKFSGRTEIDISNNPTLVLTFPDGSEIEVELFERRPNRLSVRTGHGSIIIHPCVTNVVEIEAEYKPKRRPTGRGK